MTFIDLGLSVLWADRNLGAEELGGFGDFFTLEEAQSYIQAHSIGGRVPTENEWNELLNKCSWNFTGMVKSHLGLVQGYGVERNNQELFIPAAGLCNAEGNPTNRGTIYCYGSCSLEGDNMVAPLSRYVEPSLGMRVQQLTVWCKQSERVSFRLIKDK